MGIDFSHCGAHWSYGGFHRFRGRLVAQLGFNWEKMTGDIFKETAPDEVENERFLVKKFGITPLIMHSDCDGKLSPNDCEKVWPHLRELVDAWPDDDYDKQQALELIEGMKKSAEDGKPLIFR